MHFNLSKFTLKLFYTLSHIIYFHVSLLFVLLLSYVFFVHISPTMHDIFLNSLFKIKI